MKTLVIHPKDRTTDFLDIVYKDIPNLTLVREHQTKDEIKNLIETHDRVMMMGHGSPYGLFSVGKFPSSNGFIIDHSFVKLLEQKDNSVFIWCNADEFVKYYKLKGFFSGMFISEVGEAYYCGLPGTSQDIVDESNFGFVKILAEHINKPQTEMFESVMNEYGELAENNPVAMYNHHRLYFS